MATGSRTDAEGAPLWYWATETAEILAWLPGYIWPWNAFHMATALIYWFYVVPSVGTMKTISWGWALWLYAVNAAAILVFYGIFELRYIHQRAQATRFKYNHRFPADALPTCSGSRARTSTTSCARSSYPSRCGPWSKSSSLVFRQWLRAVGRLAGPPGLSCGAGAGRAGHPRGAFLLHPSPDPLGTALSLVPFVPPQFDQPVALVVAVDASGGRVPLSCGRVLALIIRPNPDRRAVQLHIAGFGAVNGHLGFDKSR